MLNNDKNLERVIKIELDDCPKVIDEKNLYGFSWMDESCFDEKTRGRYGENGYLYNIHSPRNPVTGEASDTYVGILEKYATYDKLPI